MEFVLTRWPNVDRLIWTAITLGGAMVVGLIVNRIVVRQLQRWAEKTSGEWDDAVVTEFRRRVPFWSVLVGLWLSAGYWSLTPQWSRLITESLAALGVLSVAAATSTIAVRFLADLARANPNMQVSGLMRNVVRIVIFTVGLLVVLRGIGVEITPMLAALGVGGLAVALALQEPLSNLFAGLFITIAGQMRIGDYLKIEGGPEGVMGDLRWNAAQLTTLAGNVVIVPNASLIKATVTNFHQPSKDSGFGVEFVVEPDVDLAAVEQIATDVARGVMREVAGGMPDVEPSVRFLGFSDLGLRCAVNVRSKQFTDQALLRHELLKRLQARLLQADIDIPTLAHPEGRRRKLDAQ